MALTPEQWLSRLSAALDARASRLANLRGYMDGNAPLPEGAEGMRDAYKQFQHKARTNFGELVVDAVVERMVPSGFSVGGASEDDDQVRAIWRRNWLQVGFADVVRDMVGLSAGYMIVSEDPENPGQALITCERPEQVITEANPSRLNRTAAALKVYRDTAEGVDWAYLHLPGAVYRFARPIRSTVPGAVVAGEGRWNLVDRADTGLSFVPVFAFVNRGGQGEFEPHTDVLDRINWGILQRLVITAMQAYRQRAIKGFGDDEDDEDDEGNEIDYGEMFKPGPGSLWQLPEGAEMWESAQSDVQGVLAGTKDDITHLAAVTRTPMATLMPDGANQSAEGAAFAREGLVFKAQDRVQRATNALAQVMGASLAIERSQSVLVDDVEVLWLPVERQSLTERADAATKAQDLPWRTRMESIWQFSADQVDKMETERAQDALTTQLTAPPTVSGVTAPTPAQSESAGIKARADAMSVLIRAGVDPQSAAQMSGLDGVEFNGLIPVALRPQGG